MQNKYQKETTYPQLRIFCENSEKSW